MKKTYIEPSVKAIEIKATAILAGSVEKFTESQSPSEALSTEFDFEEEDEY